LVKYKHGTPEVKQNSFLVQVAARSFTNIESPWSLKFHQYGSNGRNPFLGEQGDPTGDGTQGG
jgi:hypothetical protein